MPRPWGDRWQRSKGGPWPAPTYGDAWALIPDSSGRSAGQRFPATICCPRGVGWTPSAWFSESTPATPSRRNGRRYSATRRGRWGTEHDGSMKLQPPAGAVEFCARAMEDRVIHFGCPKCGHEFRVKDEFAGKRVRCKACGLVFLVPTPEPEEPVVVAAVPVGIACAMRLATSSGSISAKSMGAVALRKVVPPGLSDPSRDLGRRNVRKIGS